MTDREDPTMTPDKMLAELAEHGSDAGSDYHDGLEGWFGWTVRDGVLTVNWRPADDDGEEAEPQVARSWRLIEQPEAPAATTGRNCEAGHDPALISCEVATELQRLREVERRARAVAAGSSDQPVGQVGSAAARFILGDDK